MKPILTAFLVFVAVLAGESDGQALERSSWGQFCNETVKCDKKAWLNCKSSTCVCMMDDMVFDHKKSKCLAKPGERCRFQITDFKSNNTVFALFDDIECVSNASCGSDYTCVCQDGYYETVSGTCEKQKDIFGTCVNNRECATAKRLVCLSGVCGCSATSNHIYGFTDDGREASCVGQGGKQLRGTDKCINGSIAINGICICSPASKSFADPNGKCQTKKTRRASCERDDECQFDGKFLTCVEGQCECTPGKYEYQTITTIAIVEHEKEMKVYSRGHRNPGSSHNDAYLSTDGRTTVYGTFLRSDGYGYAYAYIMTPYEETITETADECVGLAEQQCNPNSHCVKSSSCKENSVGTRICKCDAGLAPTSSGTCALAHGVSCSATSACSDSFRCTNGICNCPQITHQIYDSAFEKCVGLVSSFCLTTSDCIPNTICTLNSKTELKQCRCEDGFVENSKGTCEKAWGRACAYNEGVPCDSMAGLECRNEICACPDTMSYFNSTLRKCVGLVGSRCKTLSGVFAESGGLHHACVNGASCIQEFSNIAGQCLCDEGFQVTSEITCATIQITTTKELTSLAGDVDENELETDEDLMVDIVEFERP